MIVGVHACMSMFVHAIYVCMCMGACMWLCDHEYTISNLCSGRAVCSLQTGTYTCVHVTALDVVRFKHGDGDCAHVYVHMYVCTYIATASAQMSTRSNCSMM